MPNQSEPSGKPRYEGVDRRTVPRTISEVELAFDHKLRDHEAREQERFLVLLAQFKEEAFPDGSTAHKQAHQAMIDAAKSEAEFWKGLKMEIAKKSIWGILQILLILLAAGLLAKLGLGSLIGIAAAGK